MSARLCPCTILHPAGIVARKRLLRPTRCSPICPCSHRAFSAGLFSRTLVISLLRLDQRFLQDIMPTVRAFRRLFENAIQNPVERNLRAVGIAILARVDQALGPRRAALMRNDVLLFRSGVEEVA